MTSPTATFFEQRREWSRRKHEIFQGYLPQFARILGKRRGMVYLVDAFAGAGSYGQSDERLPGSPLLAAQIAADLAGHGYDLRCINVEADKRTFADLSANTAPYAQFVRNIYGRFVDKVDSILDHIRSAPALFFLDPYGVGDIEWRILSKIVNRGASAPTELLVNFNAPKFDRHAGWLDSPNPRLRAAFEELLNRVTGTDEWQDIWRRDEQLEKTERYSRILDFYAGRIHKEFKMRTGSYPVRTVSRGYLKYFLVFATRESKAIRIMSSIFYYVDLRYQEEYARFVVSVQVPPVSRVVVRE